MIDARFEGGGAQRYFLPLAIDWGAERAGPEHAAALARVRQKAETGLLFDAFAHEGFCRDLVERIVQRDDRPVGCGDGMLRFLSTTALEALAPDDLDELEVRRPAGEGTNSTFLVGDSLFLKAYRRLREGVNPEWEMGRFLTEVSPCRATVPVAGAIEYRGPEGEVATLALLQAATKNQGDGWSYTLSYLERFVDDALTRAAGERPEAVSHAEYLALIRTLARRTADLHRALAAGEGDPAFEPEPFGPDRLAAWVARIEEELAETMRLLRSPAEPLPENVEIDMQRLDDLEAALRAKLAELGGRSVSATSTRYHGDLHLGQVLLTGADWVIVDLEGEPGRDFDERREKAPPLKDVAGMLRSFDYARGVAARSVGAEREIDRAELDVLLDNWAAATREAFLDEYRYAMEGCASFPAEPDDVETLLELGILQKLLYEVRYELRNRPEWLALPLNALDAAG